MGVPAKTRALLPVTRSVWLTLELLEIKQLTRLCQIPQLLFVTSVLLKLILEQALPERSAFDHGE
jgi:hypothetical protein